MNHFHKRICYDKDNNYKIVSNDLYKNGIFDNNDNEIANNIARKITIPEENKQTKNKKRNNDTRFKRRKKTMEENKVENVINIIKGMYIKDKLRLGICLTTSDLANILYNKTEIYEKFDTMLKEVDEEYRTTLINFAKYKLVMFTMAKIMEMTKEERNKVALYLFNCA